MAVTATFDPIVNTLNVFGDTAANTVTVSRTVAGDLLVNSGAVAIVGGPATIANTAVIQAFGAEGADTLTLDETNGALSPFAILRGNEGNDTVTGGSSEDQLLGGADNDTLLGRGGVDILNGGDGNDTLTGGAGDDQMFGDAGNDRMIWNPGDGNDLMEGGTEDDVAEVNGGNGAEVFALTLNGARVRFDRITPVPFTLDIGTTESFILNMNGGDDSFSATGNLASVIGLTIDGGVGNDTILGSNGADILFGGADNDFIDGNQSTDTAFLGAGNDIFNWDPGDSSDVVEGQGDSDTLNFNGANVAEIITISANGGRVLFTRNIGAVVMDLNDVETVRYNALGGVDTVTVNDLSGTDVTTVLVDLAGTLGGVAGDAAVDQIIVNGTASADTFSVFASGGTVYVAGLAASTVVAHAEPTDVLVVNGQGGADTINAAGLPAGVLQLGLNGNAGNDSIVGSGGADTLTGGDDADTIVGGPGGDQIFGDAGADRMVWNNGDGSDVMEGGTETDTVEVNGGDGAETFTVAPNVTRVLFSRTTPAPFSLDIGTTENLVLNMNGGDDTFSATGSLAGVIALVVDGGSGNDTINGGNGVDFLLGGIGSDLVDGNQNNDTAFLGSGDDTFNWDPGDGSDIVEGQDGADTLNFNGANVAEIVAISANGGRALLTRNVASIVMDLNDVETLRFNALGGLDQVTVNDLAGTDVTSVTVDLAGTLGGATGDLAVDQVRVDGSVLANAITLLSSPGSLLIGGLAAVVSIQNAEGADQVAANGGGGDDAINASPVAAGVALLTLNGGDGNDAILGSAGADVLLGGNQSDVLTGGPGADAVNGEAGNDLMVWNPGDGSDVMDGGADQDTVLVNGETGAENFIASGNAGRVTLARLSAVSFSLDIGTTEVVVLAMNDGADMFTAGSGLLGLTQLVIDGGAGNDTIAGGEGADQLFGGDGADLVSGGASNDVAFLGADNDTFTWSPGEGSDVVEGQGGTDTLQFFGSSTAETFSLLASGNRVGLFRDVGAVVMNLGGIETVALSALLGTDTVTIGDLSGTDLATVAVDLASSAGGATPDGALDRVFANGSAGGNTVAVSSSAGLVTVTGLPATVTVAHADATDQLVVSGNAGGDVLNASGLAAGLIQLTLDGGDNGDQITGSQGVDVLLGGLGDDVVAGGLGGDVVFLGDGADLFTWNPGDGSDRVEGETGQDTLVFNGAGVAETFTLSPNGARASLSRDVGSVVMDLAGLETIDIEAGAGADIVTVNDLAVTGITTVQVGLAAPGAVGDGVVDRVTINGTGGAEQINLASNASGIVAAGLAATVTILQAEAGDQLVVEGGGGPDVLNGSGVAAGQISLTLSGGAGSDLILGSAGGDVIRGGDGGDGLFGLAGADRFVVSAVSDSNLATGYDTIGDFQTGTDILDLSAFGAQPSQALILSSGGSTSLYLDTDGATPGFEVAIAFSGANAIALSDILF